MGSIHTIVNSLYYIESQLALHWSGRLQFDGITCILFADTAYIPAITGGSEDSMEQSASHGIAPVDACA